MLSETAYVRCHENYRQLQFSYRDSGSENHIWCRVYCNPLTRKHLLNDEIIKASLTWLQRKDPGPAHQTLAL